MGVSPAQFFGGQATPSATPMPQGAPQGQGMTPQQFFSGTNTNAPATPQAPSVGGFLGNAVGSVGNLIGGVGNAVMHPIQTVENLGGAAVGAGEQALNTVAGTNFNNAQTQSASNLENFYNQRYGISDLASGNVQGAAQKILTSLYTDPAGVAADLSVLLGGAGAIAGKIGDLGEAGAAADAVNAGDTIAMGGRTAEGAVATPGITTAGKVGQAMTSAGEAINPFNVITKPIAALGDSFSNLQNTMEKANLRLTPTQAVNLGNNVDNITRFISDNVPIGSPEARFNTVSNMYNSMEDTLTATLRDNPEVGNLTVPKSEVLARLQALPDNFKDDPALYPLAKRQIAEATQAIQDTQGDNITMSQLNQIKRSYSGNAFDQLGVKLKSEVKLAISSVPRQMLEDTLKNNSQEIAIPQKLQPLFNGQESVPLKEFNKTYGTVIQTRKFLGLAANKAEAGPFARILSGMGGGAVGSVMGGPIGAAIGAAAGEGIASKFSTPLRSIAGAMGSGVGKVLIKAPTIGKAALVAAQAGNASKNINIKKY